MNTLNYLIMNFGLTAIGCSISSHFDFSLIDGCLFCGGLTSFVSSLFSLLKDEND